MDKKFQSEYLKGRNHSVDVEVCRSIAIDLEE
jgi:hypothetical protein